MKMTQYINAQFSVLIVLSLVSLSHSSAYVQNITDPVPVKTKFYLFQYPSNWTLHVDHAKDQPITQLGRIFRDYYTTPITSSETPIASFSIDVFNRDDEFFKDQVATFGSGSDTRNVIEVNNYENKSLSGKHIMAESMVFSPEKDKDVLYFVDTWILNGQNYSFRVYFSTSDPQLYRKHQIEAVKMVDSLHEL
jgi:hypothetical protein